MINLDLNIEKKSADLFSTIEDYITLHFKKKISQINLDKEDFFSVFIDDYSKKDHLILIKPYSGKIYLISIKVDNKFYPLVQINVSDNLINLNIKISNNFLKYNFTLEIIQSIIIDFDKIFLYLFDDIENMRFLNIKKKYNEPNYVYNKDELLSLQPCIKKSNSNFGQNDLLNEINKFNKEYDSLISNHLLNYKTLYSSQINLIKSVTFIIEINSNDIPEMKRLLKLIDIEFNFYVNVIDKSNESNDYLKGSIENNFNLLKKQKLNNIVIFSDFNNLKYFIDNINNIIHKFNSRKYLGILGKNLDTFREDVSEKNIYFSLLENRKTGIIIGDLPKKLKKLENLKVIPNMYFNRDFNFCCKNEIIKNVNESNFLSKEELLKTISNSCYKTKRSIKHLQD